MKKICFITTVSITMKAFLLKTAEYIHENTDWEISFICDEDEAFAKALPTYIRYFPVSMKRGISFSGLKAIGRMKKIFYQEKFDMIQYSTPNASFYASIAGKKAKVPVRLYCQWGMVYVGFSGLKRRIFKAIEKMVCRNSTWIEPDSKSNLDFAHKEKLYPASKGSVVWNGSACGVNFDKFDLTQKENYRKAIRVEYKLPSDAFVYGFIGRITKEKGIDELFSAFKEISEKTPNAYLMLVGSTDKEFTINEELLRWSKENERVIYTGHTDVVEQFISAMDVYILPSYREGFGMGVVEAQAMGVPVIVTRIPGPVDAMLDGVTGRTVEKGSVESLLAEMQYMYENADERAAMGERAASHVRESFEQRKLLGYILDDRKKLLGVDSSEEN